MLIGTKEEVNQHGCVNQPVAEADEGDLSWLHIHSTRSSTRLSAHHDLSPLNPSPLTPWPLTPWPLTEVGEVGSDEWHQRAGLQACAECSMTHQNAAYHIRWNETSPQSNLRRACRSSRIKRIANYWDRTALACWQWDLGHAYGRRAAERCRWAWCRNGRACCVCFATFLHMNFSSTPTLILNLTMS